MTWELELRTLCFLLPDGIMGTVHGMIVGRENDAKRYANDTAQWYPRTAGRCWQLTMMMKREKEHDGCIRRIRRACDVSAATIANRWVNVNETPCISKNDTIKFNSRLCWKIEVAPRRRALIRDRKPSETWDCHSDVFFSMLQWSNTAKCGTLTKLQSGSSKTYLKLELGNYRR